MYQSYVAMYRTASSAMLRCVVSVLILIWSSYQWYGWTISRSNLCPFSRNAVRIWQHNSWFISGYFTLAADQNNQLHVMAVGGRASGGNPSSFNRNIDRLFEDAQITCELRLSGRKLKEFPKAAFKYHLKDTVIAGEFFGKFSRAVS